VGSTISPAAPFEFIGAVELREILSRRARDERELLEALEEVPKASIYYHTHGVFLRDLPAAGGYLNDFANWVARHVHDRVLAERLGVVDPFGFLSLEELREEFVSIVDHHIATLNPVPRVVFGEPFFFVQSEVIPLEGAAYWIRHLLSNPELMNRMGQAGHEHVRRNFLITRHLRDYLALFARLSR